ncbi:MAG TPA: HEAT repeat domain-containing protein [Tepidisphaeraceae bacterium]|nr:HEAT repeat domain-containing protein [Tepidisphaeraceae bacterium]
MHHPLRIALLFIPSLTLAAPLAVPDSPSGLPNWPPPVVAPFLSPEDAIKTIQVPPGFHLEVVAAEPLIQHPVALSWDPDGRMYVVEMRSYMPDVNGDNESAPTGRITILESTQHTARMDKATTFLDHLVLPRAVSFVQGGVLVGAPPKLLFCKDNDNDGKCDQQTVVETDFGVGGNPEHQPNGLMPALDNWIYSPNYSRRLRYLNGSWISDPIPELGQWGISQDDQGRLYENSNTDQLRASLFPPHYADRNSHYRATGAYEQVAKDQTVWPLHSTAVDRGYVHTLMRDDGTLLYFTAACAPCVYRGGLYPPEFNNNVFVCEPAGNLIKRNLITPSPDGSLVASDAYSHKDFLASTYERFRPVNLFTGPDGCLYIVDMHHGILQHRTYLTTYCKDQYLARQLEKHMDTGRIYRIVPDNIKPFPEPHLSTATTAQLIDTLHHPNGWWRDTAQRLLVEKGDFKSIPPLKKMATTDANPLARLHAAWTLEGLHAINPDLISKLLADSDPRIRAAAIRIAEPLIAVPATRAKVLPAILKLSDDSSPDVRLQLTLTLTPLGTPETDSAVTSLLSTDPTPLLRDATLTGLRGRELPFLSHLLSTWPDNHPGRSDLVQSLSRCILNEGSPKNVADLLRLTASLDKSWQQLSVLDGLEPPGTRRRRNKRFAPVLPHQVTLAAEPKEFLSLQARPHLKDSVENTLAIIHWPGQPGYTPPPPPKPLTSEQQARFTHGQAVYNLTCIACHKADGQGQAGLAPPLVDSEWAIGPQSRVLRIVLQGLQGPITVSGQSYALDMPALSKLSDDDIASVLTFVRRNWDHTANPVDPSAVKQVRATTRPYPWSERELLKVP